MNRLVPIGNTAAVAALVLLLAGASYARGAPAVEIFSLAPSAIQVDPKRPNIIYASTVGNDTRPGGVFKSTDAGKTWRSGPANLGWKPPPGLGIRVDALALDPRSPNVLYAGTGLGVFKTTDGARTWKLTSDGIDLRDGNNHLLYEGAIYALGIDPVRTSTVYAAGMGGVWKTTTGGATWKRVLRYRVLSVAIDPRRPKTVYGSAKMPSKPTRTTIFKTVDGGGRWRRSGPLGLHGNYFGHPIVVDPHRAGRIYAGGSRGLFASANGGRTWKKLLSGTVGAIELDPVRAKVLYVGGWARGALKSVDGGETWSKLRLGMPNVFIIEIAPTSRRIIYAGGGDGIWKSTDFGVTWHRLTR